MKTIFLAFVLCISLSACNNTPSETAQTKQTTATVQKVEVNKTTIPDFNGLYLQKKDGNLIDLKSINSSDWQHKVSMNDVTYSHCIDYKHAKDDANIISQDEFKYLIDRGSVWHGGLKILRNVNSEFSHRDSSYYKNKSFDVSNWDIYCHGKISINENMKEVSFNNRTEGDVTTYKPSTRIQKGKYLIVLSRKEIILITVI